MMNGIYLQFALDVITTERSFNKYKCIFNKVSCQHTTQTLSAIEHDLLKKCTVLAPGKTPVYRVSETLHNGALKVFNGNTNHFIIRIYGIWENDTEYGLTYKINDF